jgi:calcineurin-like phosphoesterase family protein
MNRELIKRWNERVKPGDMVIFAGDFCFKNTKASKERGEGDVLNWKTYRDQLNGEIVFLQGNHDGNNSLPTKIKNLTFTYAGQDIFVTHMPENANPKIMLNLVGHVHEKWKIKRLKTHTMVNIGVDAWGFRPIRMEEIFKELTRR